MAHIGANRGGRGTNGYNAGTTMRSHRRQLPPPRRDRRRTARSGWPPGGCGPCRGCKSRCWRRRIPGPQRSLGDHTQLVPAQSSGLGVVDGCRLARRQDIKVEMQPEGRRDTTDGLHRFIHTGHRIALQCLVVAEKRDDSCREATPCSSFSRRSRGPRIAPSRPLPAGEAIDRPGRAGWRRNDRAPDRPRHPTPHRWERGEVARHPRGRRPAAGRRSRGDREAQPRRRATPGSRRLSARESCGDHGPR